MRTDTSPEPVDWHERARLACVRGCRWTSCTGKGATVRWSHRCQLNPAPVPLGPCHVDKCERPAVTMLPRGRVCTEHRPVQPRRGDPIVPPAARPEPHDYGPVDPDDATARPWCEDCQAHGLAHRHTKAGRRG